MTEVVVWVALGAMVLWLGGYGIWALQQDNAGTPQQRRGLLCLVVGLLLLGGGMIAAVVHAMPTAPPEAPVRGMPPGLTTRAPGSAGGTAPGG